MALYKMSDLARITGRREQTIHKVFREDEEIKALLPQHRFTKGKRNVSFDDVILDALKQRFGIEEPAENKNAVENRVVGDIEDNTNPEKTETTPGEGVETSADAEQELEALRRQVEVLETQLKEEQAKHEQSKADLEQQLETERKGREAERADLEKQLQDKEAERRHFIGENAKLLNMLAAEQEEKSKLLLLMPPAEHRTFKQKIKGLFTRKEAAKSE